MLSRRVCGFSLPSLLWPSLHQIPELPVESLGETAVDRLENLTLAPKDDLLKVAVIPDNKRDWVQDVP